MNAPSSDHLPHRFRRRGALIFVLCVVAVPALTVALALSRAERFEATAVLLSTTASPAGSTLGSTQLGGAANQREAATNLALLNLPVVALRTARKLGDGWTSAAVQDAVSVSPSGNSELARVVATARSPELAVRVADAYADTFVEYSAENDRAAIQEQIDLLRAALNAARETSPAEVAQLRALERELGVAAALQTGGTRVAQHAELPTGPSSPRPVRAGVLGGLGGILLGLVCAFLLIRTDRKLRSSSQAAGLLELPVLAGFAKAPLRGGRVDFGALRLDSQMLHANLRYVSIDEPVRSLIVTSAGVGDGKSTVAAGLALAAAEAGQSAVLVEADLRRPRLAASLGLEPGRGLSTVLSGMAFADDVVQPVPVAYASHNGSAAGAPTFDLLAAGPVPPNPADLVSSRMMSSLIDGLQARYDLVVVDTPPAGVVADAIHMVSLVDGLVIVVRIDETPTNQLEALSARITQGQARALGIVVNAEPRRRGGYHYGSYEPVPA